MRFKKVYIEITNSCNRNCSFCSKSNRVKEEMSIENFKHTIKEVKPFTNYIYLHIKGEPLLHSKFSEIINICDKEKMNINITTNGSLLSKYKDVISKSKSIRQINISLHSYTDLSELTVLFDTVKYLNEKTDIYFVYRYWIVKENEIISNNKYIKSLIEYYKFNDELIKKICNDDNIKINEHLYINKGQKFIWPELNNNLYNENGICYGLKTHIGILSNGVVVPCCLDGEGIINLGNVFEKSLKEIMNSEKVNNIINNFHNNKKIEELCKHCNFIKSI